MTEQDLVALQLPPGPRFARELDEAWARGAAVLPLDPHAPVRVVEAMLTALRPTMFVDEFGRNRRSQGVEVAPGTALVVPTSGSSGSTKGVVLSHDALISGVSASLGPLGAEEGDRWLLCLPTHHVAGITVLLRSLATGRPAVVHPEFDVEAVRAAEDVQFVSLVPTQLARLLDAGVDIARFRAILLGGAAPPPGLLVRAQAAGGRVVTSYGMTETCGGCVYDGRPLDDVQVRIAHDERIEIAGPILFDRYRFEPDRTRQVMNDGWLRTSDRGRIDEDGLLHVLGRADDVIVSGGENVPAGRVRELIAGLDGVADVSVVGVQDREWGQRVVAAIVAEHGTDVPDLMTVRSAVRAVAPTSWAPRQLLVLERLPRTGLGKVDGARLALLADDAFSPDSAPRAS